jgi:diphosphoinositol-polyphosphate diphosphatase
VPLSNDRKSVLLIQSMRRGGWVLPKGGWEVDETVQEAACREAWEEAGAVCKIHSDLGKIPEKRKPDQLTEKAPKAAYHFFEAVVDAIRRPSAC